LAAGGVVHGAPRQIAVAAMIVAVDKGPVHLRDKPLAVKRKPEPKDVSPLR